MTAKKRARLRIGSDVATGWARNLELGNPYAKSVLRALGEYVDGEGMCWVGIPQLAMDCDLSQDTVRRRLAWLEDIGAIGRTGQWVDENGRRNGEGRGKRTTDLVRLLVDADTDAIEARAAGRAVDETPVNSKVISPSWQQGLNSDVDDASPRPALGQPSQLCDQLISEPEPEDSPKAPLGGASAPAQGEEEGEPEHFGEAWEAWPGHQAMRRDLALAEFGKLSAEERRLCRAAIPHFLKMLRHLKRDHVPNFHIWVRNRGFREFPTAVLEESSQASQSRSGYISDSVEGRAIKALYRFARMSPFEHRGLVNYSLPVTARMLAFAELPSEREWHWIDAPAQLAAWSKFLSEHIHQRRPDLTTTRGTGAEARRGFMAPWPWPPRKDGTIASQSSDEAGESE
ncbi:helix-turn-helix domain-containing protein [Bradyrhizobium viridifuturi]|uniref:helix-turn-helix domain-containing protein n=1 Tax=Bradyrhizobium viridifuturi TaxID=1654716 RepID=UPI00067E80E1|nr:helix-turn-helix domain-containing protein [Bradyrhizobium viridifuturi]